MLGSRMGTEMIEWQLFVVLTLGSYAILWIWGVIRERRNK